LENIMKKAMTRFLILSLTLSFTLMTVMALFSQKASAQGPRGRRNTGATVANGGVSVSSPAPTGNYTATTGASAGTVSGAGPRGRARGSQTTGSTSGGSVSMTINRYLTSTELSSFLAAQDAGSGQMIKAISNQNYGTVTIAGQSFTINMAASAKVGTGYVISLVSARPFSTETGSGGRSAAGGSVGYIKLTVDANGNGTGALYTSTQVVVNNDGTVTARAGGSTATMLSSVQGPK
jgi:hypothetical protein